MAINVNTVYKTVLLILNKEQRGYMTPTEFDSIATQVQLEIFEKYFDDLNQQIRVPQSDMEYSNRGVTVEEKMSIFKTTGNAVPSLAGSVPCFIMPIQNVYGAPCSLYRLGSLAYQNIYGSLIEMEKLQKSEFYYIQNSALTASTEQFPTYIYEGEKIFTAPSTILSGVQSGSGTNVVINFIRKPIDPHWGFTIGARGQYIYNPAVFVPSPSPDVASSGSINFELDYSEQTELILKILIYAGVIVKDPQVIQVAAQQVQSEEANSKS